jgi:aminodeoxyfutalosine synthase
MSGATTAGDPPEEVLSRPGVADLTNKIDRGERLDAADGLALYESVDLLALGAWARAAKIRRSGDAVFINVNCHINPTNICRATCAYCGFARREDDPEAWLLEPEEIARRAAEAHDQGIREFHLVGGLHPRVAFSYYLRSIELIREAAPGASVKALTAVEVDYYAERDGRPIDAVLDDLAGAGVVSITGGGAEIFEPSVRKRLASHKVGWERWSTVHRCAHAIGMRTSATMLFGHIEAAADRVDHVLRLRELQDETGGFDVFVPLRFQPSGRLADLMAPTAAESLRVFAASRLLLDNFDHIKAFTVMNGLSLAQLALEFGADDLEGTIAEYRIVPDPDGETPRAVMVDEYSQLVREGEWTPVERNTRYGAAYEDGQATVAS